MVSENSMSPVRDGPVMNTADLEARTMGRVNASESDGRRSERHNTAIWISGNNEACKGFPSPSATRIEPVSASPQMAFVTPARILGAGVPLIRAATTDLFTPQAVNWDLLGGVSFRKGCYPGQEIVARMQYLGRLKERLFAFHVDALDVAPAMRLHSATFGADQPCGTVVDAAPDGTRGSVLLAVTQLGAVDTDDLALGAVDGPRLERRSLPYDVPGVAAADRIP